MRAALSVEDWAVDSNRNMSFHRDAMRVPVGPSTRASSHCAPAICLMLRTDPLRRAIAPPAHVVVVYQVAVALVATLVECFAWHSASAPACPPMSPLRVDSGKIVTAAVVPTWKVGLAEGEREGRRVGEREGDLDGDLDGEDLDGALVGEDLDGALDGDDVMSELKHTHTSVAKPEHELPALDTQDESVLVVKPVLPLPDDAVQGVDEPHGIPATAPKSSVPVQIVSRVAVMPAALSELLSLVAPAPRKRFCHLDAMSVPVGPYTGLVG